MDYRDLLVELFHSLNTDEGLTHCQISRRTGVSEQTISNVLKKRRNFSTPALNRVLQRLGYELHFEPRPAKQRAPSP